MTNIGLEMNKRWHHCKRVATDYKSVQNSFQFYFITFTRKQNMFPSVFAMPFFMKWSFNMSSKNTVQVQSICFNTDFVLVGRLRPEFDQVIEPSKWPT